MLGHQVKIGVEVDELQRVLRTEGADQNIDRLPHGYAPGSEESAIGR